MVSLVVLSACSKVRFEEPQPSDGRELTEIPSQMHGHYLDDSGDSLSVGVDYFQLSCDDKKRLAPERIVLKKKGDYYFLSCNEEIISGNAHIEEGWEVLPFQMVDDTLILYFIDTTTETDKQQSLTLISSILPMQTRLSGHEEYYVVNPSVREFSELMRSGVFSVLNKYTKYE